MKEAYVTLEIAERLKALGFREETNRYYNAQYDQIRTVSDTFMMDWNDEEHMSSITMPGAVSIPTHQMTVDWLIEKYNMIIVVEPNHHADNEWDAHIWKGHYRSEWSGIGFSNRFDAVEKSIEYALDLIEIKNKEDDDIDS